jgi:site-specific DNA-methyltransferase (adenine-specific)
MLDLNRLYLMDCMDGMAQFPDKYFELAIVDPPYGGVTNGGYMSNADTKSGSAKHPKYNLALWAQAKPEQAYFDELFRVSKNQIVWGGNYFQTSIRSDSQCWLVWDKRNENTGFADCELAWTSFNSAVRKFEFMWNGMLQGDMKNKEFKIHPTQKPVALYSWILANYAKPGDKILDTHVGSASSLIACHQMGFEFVGFEIDPDYYKAATERLEQARAQVSMLDIGGEKRQTEQIGMEV